MGLQLSWVVKALFSAWILLSPPGSQLNAPGAVPVGTAFPVVFSHTINTADAKIGDTITTKTTQVVILPSGERIPRGSELIGEIVASRPRSSDEPSQLGIRFETLLSAGSKSAIRVRLRAMASFADSYSSRSALVPYDTPDNSLYSQVGGDTFFPYDAVHSPRGTVVGKATRDGIFVKLARTSAESNDQIMCDETDTLQSVGIFSSGACGLYGFGDFFLDEAGTKPDGVIRFHAERHSVKIGRGTLALLQVQANPR